MSAPNRPTRTVLVLRSSSANPAPLVPLEALAREAGLHPELVRRLIALGGIESSGTSAAPLFPIDSAARLARIVRLRRDLGVNYAGALLAVDLLQRIDELEALIARREAPPRR